KSGGGPAGRAGPRAGGPAGPGPCGLARAAGFGAVRRARPGTARRVAPAVEAGRPMRSRLWVLLVFAVLAACTTGTKGTGGDGHSQGLESVPKGCAPVDMAVSSEKITLLTTLASRFNDSSAARRSGCVFVRIQSKASGAAM